MMMAQSAWNSLDENIREKFKEVFSKNFTEFFRPHEEAEMERLEKVKAEANTRAGNLTK